MSENRIALLKKFVEEDPTDPFNKYALALELTTLDPDQAAALFDGLMQQHPEYLPTYYQAGVYYITRGEHQKAIQILRAGMELAKQQRNPKTLAELNALLEDLE